MKLKQRFRMFTFVEAHHVNPPLKAIVGGSYSQLFGGKNVNSYMLYSMDGDKVVRKTAWYDENVLSSCSIQNRELAEGLIEEYNLSQEDGLEELLND